VFCEIVNPNIRTNCQDQNTIFAQNPFLCENKVMISKIITFFANLNLRFKVAVLVVIPIMVSLMVFSMSQYYNERRMMAQQIESTTIQMGDLLLGSLRHGMLANDPALVRNLLSEITRNKTISRIWIINMQGMVKISSLPGEENTVWPFTSVGCVECHRYNAENRPRVIINGTGKDELMRVSTPILNLPECWTCHSSGETHLGVLMVDAALPDAERNILVDLRNNMIMSIFFSLLFGIGVYFLISKLIVQRIEKLHKVMGSYSNGNFNIRFPDHYRKYDEIDMLGRTYNQMAERLKEHELQLAERVRVREIAIVEERERIARELHDGIAQFLGYITTKTQAARLFIEKGNSKKADEFLRQIEGETHNQAIDVRASILGLKMFSDKRQGIASDIRNYLNQSNRFLDIEVVLEVDERFENLLLDSETELQFLRIMQEAISNVRKHSQALKARIILDWLDDGMIKLSICDDGVGFDAEALEDRSQPRFGLSTMRERAEAIGGQLNIKSSRNSGTEISVTIKLPEKDQ
jgi:signal transduction histidine kinase